MDPAEVIARIRKGNADAFESVIAEHQAGIIRYLYRLTGNYEASLDLCQDTFIQAYRNIMRTGPELNLRAWLYKIATNNARQYHRRRRIISFVPFESKDGEASPEKGIMPGDPAENAAIREALLKVPRRQRECLVLHYIEGFKYREIAETMAISEEAVRKLIARGKESFRRFYDGGTE